MAEVPARLFVYGTLMPGQVRWRVLQALACAIEPATAQGQLWDTGAGYPAARFDPGGGEIPGVLVDIPPELFPDVIGMLDRIEAEGVLFRRVNVLTSGGPAASYEWMGPTDGLLPLHSGWWDTS